MENWSIYDIAISTLYENVGNDYQTEDFAVCEMWIIEINIM